MSISGRFGGYTIVETMIFLAITGMLFFIAVTTVGGKLAAVQFSQSTRDAQSRITGIINQVATGYYPNNQGTCKASAADSTNPPTFSAEISELGTSEECVFLGKVLQFGTGTNRTQYNVISMAARKTTKVSGRTQEVSSLQEAIPTAIPGITESFQFEYGLSVTKVLSVSNPNIEYGSVALFSSLPKFSASSGTLASGTLRVGFGVIPDSVRGDSVEDATSKASSITDKPADPLILLGSKKLITINPAGGIIICLADNKDSANASRWASISIGTGAVQTSSVLKLFVKGENRLPCP